MGVARRDRYPTPNTGRNDLTAVLLDTHAAIWLLNGDTMDADALSAIARAQLQGAMFLSPITAWEAALAQSKPTHRRPDLKGMSASEWFRAALALPGAVLLPIRQRIAIEAARVPAIYGNGDTGDCFLIASARVRRVPLVTRDQRILELAARTPAYVAAIRC